MSEQATKPAAVVFDFGRVLIQWDLRFLFEKLVSDPAELDWLLDNVITEEWHFQQDAGRPLAEMVSERKAAFPDHAELLDAYVERFQETLPAPVPGTGGLIERLAARGVPLFGLTNFGHEFFPGFRERMPVLRHFRDIVVSGQEKCCKPEPRIYEIAEQRFGFAPEDLFFTDDNPANIAAAEARAWQTHLFRDAPTLERELKSRGLLG